MRNKLRLAWSALPSLSLMAFIGVLSTTCLLAQPEPVPDAPAEAPFQPAVSVGLSTGSHAFLGADATFRLIRPVDFRIGYNRMRAQVGGFNLDASTLGFSGQNLILDSELNLSTLSLLADFPVNQRETFRLLGGVMINLDNYINVKGRFAEGVALNDYVIPPERVGVIDINYTTGAAVYPFFGLGFGRSVAARHLSFALETGIMVRGRPDIEFNSTGLLHDNAHNGPVLSENFKSVRVHPSVSLRLAYRINLPKNWWGPRPETTSSTETPAPASDIAEEPQTAPAAEESAAEPADAPPANISPYVVLHGIAIDAGTKEPLERIYVDLYEINPDGSKSLARTGPYPSAKFTLGLEPGNTYELKLIGAGYQPFTKILKVQSSGGDVNQNFLLEPEQ